MKKIKLILAGTSLAVCFIVTNSCSQTTPSATLSVLGVFKASTPCSKGTKPVPGIPLNADCEFIKWMLTLYRDPNTLTPTNYKLSCVYGLSEPGTPGFIGGGSMVEMKGKWTIVKGTGSNPDAMIYQLDPDKPKTSISFLKLSDDLLHLLDSDKRLMIGSAAWSYTLNKIKEKS